MTIALYCRDIEFSVWKFPCVNQVTMNSVISFISYHFLAQHHPLPIVCLSGTLQLPRALASILAAYNAAYSKNPHELLLLLHIFALHVPLSMTACLTLLFISHFLPFSVFVFFFFQSHYWRMWMLWRQNIYWLSWQAANSQFLFFCLAWKVTWNF